MSKEMYYYKEVDSETAYLAGIAEAFAASLDMELSSQHYAVDTDVFRLDENGMDGLYDLLLERLRHYNDIDEYELDLEKDSFMPNIPYAKVTGNKTPVSVTNIIREYVKTDKILPAAKDFFFSVNWHLKLPKAVYRTDMQALYEYMPELEKAMRAFYLFIISEILFVEYDGYVLMLVIGSNE